MVFLASASTELDATTLAQMAGVPVESIRGALSNALARNRIHVSSTDQCKGGRRFYYRMGPKPLNPGDSPYPDPFKTLEAMRESSRRHGFAFK